TGRAGVALPELRLHKRPETYELMLEAWNAGTVPCEITTKPQAYHTDPETTLALLPGDAPQTLVWTIAAAGFWYDIAITSSTDSRWLRRFAGRMETGKHGISDPALSGLPFAC
ncbi:MAG TPA: phospholipase domain-containing protein, partial [Polyangiales bacterium]|nr:phospholipase domain-containing protein [Polyangiales bacterium]